MLKENFQETCISRFNLVIDNVMINLLDKENNILGYTEYETKLWELISECEIDSDVF